MHTTLAAAKRVPIWPPESRHERRLFGSPQFGSPRPLDALADQGRYFLAHRDSVRQAEAAAAAAGTGSHHGSSQPWWQPWRQAWQDMRDCAQLDSSAAKLPARERAALRSRQLVRRYFRELPPLDDRKGLAMLPWGGALELLARFPGRALLQPDDDQVQTGFAVCSWSCHTSAHAHGPCTPTSACCTGAGSLEAARGSGSGSNDPRAPQVLQLHIWRLPHELCRCKGQVSFNTAAPWPAPCTVVSTGVCDVAGACPSSLCQGCMSCCHRRAVLCASRRCSSTNSIWMPPPLSCGTRSSTL